MLVKFFYGYRSRLSSPSWPVAFGRPNCKAGRFLRSPTPGQPQPSEGFSRNGGRTSAMILYHLLVFFPNCGLTFLNNNNRSPTRLWHSSFFLLGMAQFDISLNTNTNTPSRSLGTLGTHDFPLPWNCFEANMSSKLGYSSNRPIVVFGGCWNKPSPSWTQNLVRLNSPGTAQMELLPVKIEPSGGKTHCFLELPGSDSVCILQAEDLGVGPTNNHHGRGGAWDGCDASDGCLY